MYHQWKRHLTDRGFVAAVLVSLLLLGASLTFNFYAGTFATKVMSQPVTDLILDNIPVFDLDGIFVWGSIIFWSFIFLLCVADPKRVPFTVKSIALFVVIRSVFISLTHIGPFPDATAIESNLLSRVTFGGDLFFSGHTGLPFLMALIYWQETRLRMLFIATSVFFGIVVLLAHLHYSIDVLAAFFITYTIYHIARILFKNDHDTFKNGVVSGTTTEFV